MFRILISHLVRFVRRRCDEKWAQGTFVFDNRWSKEQSCSWSIKVLQNRNKFLTLHSFFLVYPSFACSFSLAMSSIIFFSWQDVLMWQVAKHQNNCNNNHRSDNFRLIIKMMTWAGPFQVDRKILINQPSVVWTMNEINEHSNGMHTQTHLYRAMANDKNKEFDATLFMSYCTHTHSRKCKQPLQPEP